MPALTQLEHGSLLLQRTLRRRQVTQLRGLRLESAAVLLAPPPVLSDDVDGFIFVVVFAFGFAVANGVDIGGGYVVYPVALFNGVSARLLLLDIIADPVHAGIRIVFILPAF